MAAKTIISAEELHALEKVRIFDCRFALMDHDIGEQSYLQAHIPNATYVHLNKELSGEIIDGKTGRHPLPSRADFEISVRNWGIENDQQVVTYDANNGAFAARMWWMMRWLGHENVAVLDGGLDAWQAAGYEIDSNIPVFPTSDFKAHASLTKAISADEITDSTYNMIDARELVRFKGEQEPVDPIAGHIPGAACLPFSNNLTSSQQFKSISELKSSFDQAHLSREQPTICYCGSGVTAAHNILALVHAGYPEPILYPGSWSEWITDPTRPISRDE